MTILKEVKEIMLYPNALLHMLQVSPLDCEETLVTCAFVATDSAMAINKKNVFILVLL